MRRLPAFAYVLAVLAVMALTTVGAPPVAAATPVAVNDEYWAAEGTALSIADPGILANDKYTGYEFAGLGISHDPTHAASFSASSEGGFDYAPVPGFVGDDTFTYYVIGSWETSNEATVTIHVVAPPVAAPNSWNLMKNLPLTVVSPGVLGNDSGPSGVALAARLDRGPDHGTLTLDADGMLRYQPTTGYEGGDSFEYSACLAAAPSICSASTTVWLSVENTAPYASVDHYETAGFGAGLSVAAPGFLANDQDANGDPLTMHLTGDPAGPTHGTLDLHADGSFTYTPDTGFIGLDRFTYEACDPDGACGSTWVIFTVPFGVHRNGELSAPAGSIGGLLTGALYTPPSHGIAVLATDGSFTYTPNAGYVGFDSFVPCNPIIPGFSECFPGQTVSISVVNDVPTAAPDTITVAQGRSVSAPAPGVLANDSDPNGDPLTTSLVIGTIQGSLELSPDGAYTYSPAASYHGTDGFVYQACDDTACSAAVAVSITVLEAPHPTSETAGMFENEALDVAAPGVLGNDGIPAGATVEAIVVSGPAHGTFGLHPDGSFAYAPASGYVGGDSFAYKVCRTDTEIEVCSATVTDNISVFANDPPDFGAGTDGATWTVAPGSLPPTVVATDPDDDAVIVDVAGGTLPSGLTLEADGSWSGSTAGLSGTYDLTLRACDTHVACTTADVTLEFKTSGPAASPSGSASTSPSASALPTTSALPTASASPTESPRASASTGASASASASASVEASSSAPASATPRITPPPTSSGGQRDGANGSDGLVLVLLAGLLALTCSIAVAARSPRDGSVH